MNIGSLQLKSRLILSPLERVSCVGFRELAARNGAGLTWTPMVRARSVAKKHRHILATLDTFDSATPTGVQLLATSRDDLTAALDVLSGLDEGTRPHWRNIQAIDLNFGCPNPDVIGYGNGPAMLRRRTKLRSILDSLAEWRLKSTESLNIGAVGLKIRLGLNEREVEHKVYLSVAEQAAEAGLDYVVVHGRHAHQRSSEAASWTAIREVVDAVQGSNLRVIGNGDVRSLEDYERMLTETGCDGVMIGRMAIHNPWVFNTLLDSAMPLWPSLEQLLQAEIRVKEWAQETGGTGEIPVFHAQNFARLRSFLETGEMTAMPVKESIERKPRRRYQRNRRQRKARA